MKSSLLSLIFLTVGLMIIFNGTITVYAQDKEMEKCFDLQKNCSEFYQERPNEDFLKSFSPRIFDEFGIITLEDELSRLDAFKQELNSSPNSVGYIVVYGGKLNKFGEISARVKRMTDCLLNNFKIDPKRLKVIQGGFREKFEFELWTSRIRDNFPPLSPTVDVEKVKFRGKMKPLPNVLY